MFAEALHLRPFGKNMGYHLPYMRVPYCEAQVFLVNPIKSLYFDLPKTTASLTSLYKSFKKPINPCFAIKAPRSWKRKEAVDKPLQGIDTMMQFSSVMLSCLINILKYHWTALASTGVFPPGQGQGQGQKFT